MSATPLNPSVTDAEKARRAKITARLTYLTIVLVFLSVCTVAVVSTMVSERNKQGFKAIHLSKPISFFDYTYVDRKPETPKQP